MNIKFKLCIINSSYIPNTSSMLYKPALVTLAINEQAFKAPMANTSLEIAL